MRARKDKYKEECEDLRKDLNAQIELSGLSLHAESQSASRFRDEASAAKLSLQQATENFVSEQQKNAELQRQHDLSQVTHAEDLKQVRDQMEKDVKKNDEEIAELENQRLTLQAEVELRKKAILETEGQVR